MKQLSLIVLICCYIVIFCKKEVASLLLFPNYNNPWIGPRVVQVRSHAQAKSLGIQEYALDFIGLVNEFGYPAEEHTVVTDDGYILKLHRIPGTPSKPKALGKPVVYLQHGILASSDSWVILGPEKDLAFILADAGYDVWLGNSRGNTYSRSHVTLNPDKDARYWKFSWQEIGMYDLPASIDYILQETQQKSLVYIGLSMGSTVSYVLLSTRPEYNDKVRLVVSLAPVAFWKGQINQFFQFLINNTKFIYNFLINSRIHEIFPQSKNSHRLAKILCSNGSPLQNICINLFRKVFQEDPSLVNTTVIHKSFAHFPTGTSAQVLLHYSQNIMDGDFRMYDYKSYNKKIYNQAKPPLFNLSNISAPVALIYGKGDNVVNIKDVYELKSRLPNCQIMEPVAHEKFTHFDFLWASDVANLLNYRVKQIVDESFNNV